MSLMTFRKSASISLPCDAGLPYEILTDYDTYGEWVPIFTQSKLLAREGDLAIAEFVLKGPREDKFAVECIHTRNKMVLTRTISGRVPVTQYEWTLESSGAGGCKVALTIEGKTNLQRFMPGYGSLLSPMMLLKALEVQIASFSADISVAGGGEQLFQLMETGDGMVCVYRDKKYRLVPMSEGSHD